MVFFGLCGFSQDKRAEAGSGTGFGGKKGDKKRLLAGRKRAEKASTRDEKANISFLAQMQTQIRCQSGVPEGDGFVASEDDKKKLAGLLRSVFQNQLPSEWGKRGELYGASLAVTRKLASNATLTAFLGEEQDQEGVLFWLLDFRQQAEQIIKHHYRRGSMSSRRGSHQYLSQEDQEDVLLAAEVIEVADAVLKILRRCQTPKPKPEPEPEPEISVISLRERYQSQLGPLRFDSADEMRDHFFLRKVPQPSSSLKTRVIFKELAAYRTALPVDFGSSCFCRVLGSRLDLLRVMITGPDDTPYANGCFFFDINLPASYPRVPPLCQFLTTGGGEIRFNPNLYDCGKVCLSLLGTWAGPGWISGQSTLLQVLISIQSLILVPDPYFNEPCFEREMGTARGKAQSKTYNQEIRKHTLSAAIEAPLKAILDGRNEYVEFEPVMIKHFLQKSSLIQKEIRIWAKDDNSLLPLCDHICNHLTRLAITQQDSKQSKRYLGTSTLAKTAAQSNKPMLLGDSDIEGVHIPEKSAGAEKPTTTIKIDLTDEDEEIGKNEANECPHDSTCDDVLVDAIG